MKVIKLIIFIILLFLVIALIFLHAFSSFNKAIETIERCKSKGWDGAKYLVGFGSKMICSNISQAEKDAMGDAVIR